MAINTRMIKGKFEKSGLDYNFISSVLPDGWEAGIDFEGYYPATNIPMYSVRLGEVGADSYFTQKYSRRGAKW